MFNWIKNQFFASSRQVQTGLDVSVSSATPIQPLLEGEEKNLSDTQAAVTQNKLGDEFYERFALSDAEVCYRKAIEIKPDFFDAHINLGLTLNDQGRYAQALDIYKQALTIKPGSALTYFNLGVTYKNQDRFSDAESSLRQALVIWPPFFQCHHMLGVVLQQQNRLDEAIESFQEAIKINPDYFEAHHRLGEVLALLGRFKEAESSFQKTLKLNQNFADGHLSYGNLLSLLGKPVDAQQYYRRSLAINPNFAQAFCNLAVAMGAAGDSDSITIEANYQRAIKLQPDYAEAYCNLGNFYNEQKRFLESEASYRRALEIKPDFANAHNCLGILLMQQGRFEESLISYRKGLSIDPDNLEARSNFLLTLSFFSGCTAHEYLEELRTYAEKVLIKAKPYTSWPAVDATAKATTLKIGLVSGDFRHHPVGFFLENVLSHLNPDRIELVAYSTHKGEDAVTARIKPYFKAWNQLVGMNDEAVAQKIHTDGIQILIDLAGHTANNRLPVFAWKPAPIQVSWLGYFASTGVPGMDYVLADPVAVPPTHQDQFTETVWYLPDTRLCFSPPTTSEAIEVAALPALRNGYITFGCFQGMAKLTDQVLALWGRVFKALPQARLRLQNRYMNSPIGRQEMQQRLSQVGISEERVTLVGPVARDVYLASHAEVDMILDTFPYTGGTTTCEALWMGVPTVTLAGDTMLSLQGASMLQCAGLTEWIAKDKDDYVARAVELSSNLEALAALRAGLREKVLASPLFDAQLFARNFEDTLHDMWQK